MNKKCIGIMASVISEGTLFSSTFKAAGKSLPRHPVCYSGTIAGNRVIFGISGMGKTNAAHAVTVLIERFSPSCIVNFGIGGAYPSSGLKVGDIAVAAKEIYADEGVLLKDGLHSLKVTGIPLLKIRGRSYFNEFPVDRRLSRQALKASGSVAHCRSGVFLTVSACTGTGKRAQELVEKFNPLCENMEGAAVAHICRLYGIPFVEIRGISNTVEDRDKGKWDVALASENCQKAVIQFLESGLELDELLSKERAGR
ncbi:MAG: futalosine hydrolase [Nitrospiraceae bacterium]|nr:MAG: futalosine hydrolase [Nitrospiraceae bacterium]